ncbi:Mitochondrial import inner membrane translocase subunit tim23 [Coemansia sp. RSA 518]|nr:Mitochondrial import inner membrane translocase subunit tim23 [Coemansia sp. RSA 520]KAJ2229664.1 Mitochondrial import inner membrane translocase subunit tim23 [Coemansia sp. RSA 518]KAJ2290860.1 Mitochondrial import inner membrane translocase subunit tim23 [Coemansia sp. RSA 355]KAJ2423616.1 Mitochondrial import inner membrane translocase subunit tim23 [Coemansia sp. RSA 2522]
MSIFSVFSRSGASAQDQQQQQQQEQLQDQQHAVDTAAHVGQQQEQQQQQQQHAPVANTYQPYSVSQAAIDQMQGGMSSILSQVDFSSPQLNPLTNVPGIEYLTIEDGPVHTGGVMPSRGWSDDLCYGTGTMYIMGLTTGGAWGFMEGMRTQHGSMKLRVNSVLNAMTRRGPFLANSLGILAMFYNSINSMIGSYRGTRDQYNNVGAAAISGMLFKIGRGPRTSIISGLLCSGVVGVYQASIMAYNGYKQKKLFSSPSEPQLSKPSNVI